MVEVMRLTFNQNAADIPTQSQAPAIQRRLAHLLAHWADGGSDVIDVLPFMLKALEGNHKHR